MQNHLLPKFRSKFLPHTRTLKYTFFTSQFHTSNTDEIQSPVEETKGEISDPAPNFNDLKLEISHPWPEWVDLMEHILKKGYFEGGIKHPFGGKEMDTNQIRSALLNFARDRFDIMRYFCKGDISVVLESGCPSLDRKVVNSGKRLRAHVGLGEGKVCSSCNLRGNCERAYVMARADEGGRTVDVMRILLTYGLDPIIGSVENKPCLNKRVKDSARKLLSEMVELSLTEVNSDSIEAVPSKKPSLSPELSRHRTLGHIKVPMKQGDWICPKCNFHNFSKNIKCLLCDGLCQEQLRKLGENQDHLPLKKGDWLCGTCNFLNFAKNTRCLQCKEKPSRRELNPGEWECPSCNYVNFKRNMVCLKCDWKRPKASNYSETTAQNQLEYESHHRSNGLDFVRNDVGSESNGSRSARRTWTNLKDDQDDGMEAWNRFEDFPIAGGKSEVSKNENTRLKWKKLMERQRRSSTMESNDDDHDDEDELGFRVPSNFVESSEDEEINDWFGCKK